MTEYNRLTGFPRSSSTKIAVRAPQDGQANAKLGTFDTVKRQTIRCGDLEIVTETWSSLEVASASSFSGEQKGTSRPLASPGSRSVVNQLNQLFDKTSQKPKQSFNWSSQSVRQSLYQSSDRPNRPVNHQPEQSSYKSRSVKELRHIFDNNP